MSTWRWLIGLAAVLPAGLAAAGPSGGSTAQVEAQLKALFDKADLNHDGYLDKEELAKGFRGPRATPPTGGLYDDKGRPTQLYSQAQSKYPDLAFLWAVDKDGDNSVSWAEYRTSGLEGYAAQQKKLQAMQRALQAAAKQASQYRANMQRQQAQLVRNLQHQYAAQQQQFRRYLQNMQHQQYHVQGAPPSSHAAPLAQAALGEPASVLSARFVATLGTSSASKAIRHGVTAVAALEPDSARLPRMSRRASSLSRHSFPHRRPCLRRRRQGVPFLAPETEGYRVHHEMVDRSGGRVAGWAGSGWPLWRFHGPGRGPAQGPVRQGRPESRRFSRQGRAGQGLPGTQGDSTPAGNVRRQGPADLGLLPGPDQISRSGLSLGD